MLPLSQRVAFSIFAVLTLVFGARGFYRVYLRIRRGRLDTDARTNKPLQRLWYSLRTTLLQERVFRKRLALSVFHSFIFYAFVLYLLVNLIDAVDGFYDLRPVASPAVRAIYGGLADAFSVLAIVGIIAFLLRRFAFRSRRDFGFNDLTLLDEKVRRGYIKQDSLIVSVFILFHVGSRIIGNAAKLAMDGPEPAQPLSSFLARGLVAHNPMAWRVFGYWGALGSVLLFLVYFPYSKHIHLLMAPVKYFFRRDAVSGELPPVKIDLEAAEPQVGASRLADLSWPRLLDAYACIQCNRCQDVCPGSQTGKALSPSALEINKRMVLNSIAQETSAFWLTGAAAFERGASSGPALLEAVISPEAVWACTTCGACMHVCPTQDEQMLDIIDIRRNAVMLQGEFPPQLQNAFRGMERSSNPWAIAREKRMDWAGSLQVPTIDEVPDPDVLYWVGCAASYDPGAQKTARATVQLLQEAGVNFAVLGKKECCTGDTARRAGNELLYQELATTAIATLNEARPKLVLASCPHCVNTIATEYPQFGGNFKVMHHTEFLASLVDSGRLQPAPVEDKVTFHDPCYLGRHRGTYEQPRSILKVLTNDLVELPRNKSNAFCCGAGGAQFWKEEERGTERISENRFNEVQRTLEPGDGNKVLAVGCPFCKSMLQSSPSAGADTSIAVKDVAELLWEGVQRAKGLNPDATESPEAPASARVPVPEPVAVVAPVPLAVAAEAQPSAASASPDQVVAPTKAVATEQTAAPVSTERKKWAPKAASVPAPEPQQDPEQPAAEVPAVVTAPNAATLAPERKKWAPKPASPAPAPGAQPVSTESSATPATTDRKKWVPKAVTPHTAAQPAPIPEQPGQQATAPEAPASTPPAAPIPERKKWAPRQAAPTAVAPQTAQPAAAETAQASVAETPQTSVESTPEPQPPPAMPARKKWQPKGPTGGS